jgi:glycosyltransferase involved in cell wall biosynthesis
MVRHARAKMSVQTNQRVTRQSRLIPRLSVVVPTYNRAELLRLTLQSLVDQQMPRDEYEVIVSDDGSSDATPIVVESFADRLRLRCCYQEDLGYRLAEARNAGARLANAPILVFLDSGSLSSAQFLRAHLDAHKETLTTPRGTAVLGYMYGYQPFNPTEGLEDAIATMSIEEVLECFQDDRNFWDRRHDLFSTINFDLTRLRIPWMFHWGGNLSVRAVDFWAVGGFDEAFRSYGTEDTELGYRMFRHGVNLRIERDAWAIEHPHERNLDVLATSCKRTMRQFLEKTREPMVEIVWSVIEGTITRTFEEEYDLLLHWQAEVRESDVSMEIECVITDLLPATRVCIVGCGGNVPTSLESAVLVDFDENLLCQAATPSHQYVHAVGLNLPLEDQSVVVEAAQASG